MSFVCSHFPDVLIKIGIPTKMPWIQGKDSTITDLVCISIGRKDVVTRLRTWAFHPVNRGILHEDHPVNMGNKDFY